MAHDKNKQPIAAGDQVLVRCCRLHGEKAAPGYVFLRTEPDAEGLCRDLAVREAACQTEGELVLVPAVVENAHDHNHGRNLLVRVDGESPSAVNRFAISSLCVETGAGRGSP